MDRSFRALADPVRRALIEELSDRNDQSLYELCGRLLTGRGLTITRQAISKHIAVLVDAGVVTVTASGRTTNHHLNPGALTIARDWIDHITRETP
jgi:DNA-binding transcriptional ArsR family regulator